jgi:group II intron reverse transcriptase/maturase
MQNAKTVLEVISERGRRGLPLERVYRQLFNRELYLRAYAKIAPNSGAMTPGVTDETVDGMSLEKIDKLIAALRYEHFRWTPVRRVYIEKKNSMKKRPLGIPTWTDKLLQEVVRSILEAYYEPQFSDHSHGFRPNRGCHTALSTIQHEWTGTKWFIEGDISGCFDNIDHEILLSIMAEKIHDGRFLRLIKELLEAGYLENWRYNATLSGTPQGGVVSPILANIYLDRLDKYVEKTLLPEYNRKARRDFNTAYAHIKQQRRTAARNGRKQEAFHLYKEMQRIPSRDPYDPEFRRLKYMRYTDDFLFGFAGPRADTEQIKARIQEFLSISLKLELSEQKTLITHATIGAARFLGYDIHAAHENTRMEKTRRRRIVNSKIQLSVPVDVVKERCRAYTQNGKPKPQPELMNDDAYSTVARYQNEYRGFAEYYALAPNRSTRLTLLRWTMQMSLAGTLAAKFKVSRRTIMGRYASTRATADGTYKVLKVEMPREGKTPLVAYWGGISLKRKPTAVLNDLPYHIWNRRTELLERLLADACELCGSQENVEVHHIRHLRDLQIKGRAPKPEWVKQMAARRRKTLVLCLKCHQDTHAGCPKAHHDGHQRAV